MLAISDKTCPAEDNYVINDQSFKSEYKITNLIKFTTLPTEFVYFDFCQNE
jgi:hypothetical protein